MQDFLRNNRGINDGGDLPVDFMEALYDRIIHNEIKMKDDPIHAVGAAGQGAQVQGPERGTDGNLPRAAFAACCMVYKASRRQSGLAHACK